MIDDTNDKFPDADQRMPASLERHLRAIMTEADLDNFQEKLPAAFVADASEGLKQVLDTRQLESVLHKLNQQMHQQLALKKTPRRKRSAGYFSWIYWAILIILLLALTAFIVVRMLLHR